MADVKISDLGELTSPAGEDLLVIVDDPSGTPVSKKVTATNLFGTVSIDADSNTVSNLEVDNFKASAIVIESEGISSNDNDTTIPTSASVKDYVDSQIATEDTIAELNDTTITSVGDNEILQYNNSSSVWENQTFDEAGIATLTGSETLTNKTLTSPVFNTGISGSAVLDEDDMNSNSATQLATQQSIKAYVDTQIATEDTITELNDTTISSIGSGELLKWDGSAWINNTLEEAGIQATITFGIADTNAVDIDDSDVADNDFAKFTANGLEGRDYSEVKTDLSLNNVENTAISTWAGTSNIVTTGDLNSGSITSGFGSIDVGSSAISTTGVLTTGAIAVGGAVDCNSNSITEIKKLDTTIGTGNVAVDFDNNEETTLTISGAVTFSGTNMGAGKHQTIHISNSGASDRTFTFPAWVFYGEEPSALTASKKACLSLTCLGSNIADVRAVYVEEG